MRHTSSPQTIAWFQDQYKNGRLELRPPFQRKPVWTPRHRSFFIESILMEIPIPEIFVQVTQSDDGTQIYGVVDGQQRLRTVLQFVGVENAEDPGEEDNNLFPLEALPLTSVYKSKTFADIPAQERKKFYGYELSVRFLHTDNRREVEEIFKRINKYTMPLQPQEIRNATYHGPFSRLSELLADDEYWAVNRIMSPAAIRRMADIEMMSDLLIGLIHGPQGGSAKIIDQYYDQYEQYEDEFPEQNRIKRLFSNTLETIKRMFPNLPEAGRWGNRADFYSLFVVIGNLMRDSHITESKERALSKKLLSFAREVDHKLERPSVDSSKTASKYARAIEKGSNDKARRVDRHEALVEVIRPLTKKAQA